MVSWEYISYIVGLYIYHAYLACQSWSAGSVTAGVISKGEFKYHITQFWPFADPSPCLTQLSLLGQIPHPQFITFYRT